MKQKNSSSSRGQISVGASFRDPAGFVFQGKSGVLRRQINKAGQADFDLFVKSGLYEALTAKSYLVPHKQVALSKAMNTDAVAVIEPEVVPFVSYPFEWSFSQLKDAALLTLAIQKTALEHDMSLKDATAYNVQFIQGKPIFIDTLSFEKYKEGAPWQAYKQFCQHFLAPLALMAYTNLSLSQLSRVYIDGIPLDLASSLLPRKAKLRPGITMHIVLHGRAQKAKESEHKQVARQVSRTALIGIIESLERTVRKLRPMRSDTEWGEYYSNTNYSAESAGEKGRLLTKLVKPLNVNTALDLGGNNGQYSRVLNSLGITTVCTDIDPNAVEANYARVKRDHEILMLPLVVDLTNPGGGLGWENGERQTVAQRLHSDLVMALALVHHLAISNNLPFSKIAEYFSSLGNYLIIEFVPKTDSQVQKLLSTRKDIFPNYTKSGLKEAFSEYFALEKEVSIPGTKRTLLLFRRK